MLTSWSSFFVMTGSAAAALTGLMFVVITLITAENRASRSREGIGTYSTPTVVHFGTVLLVSVIFTAPWPLAQFPAVLVGVAGLAGVLYVMNLCKRMWHFTEQYSADVEDWLCYAVLPLVGYVAILLGAIALPHSPWAMFAIAGGMALFLFIGIHNAWDIVVYVTSRSAATEPSDERADE